MEYIDRINSLIKTFNDKDEEILKEIIKNNEIGTINLAKKIKIAPKNLIVHLKNLELAGLIRKEKIKQKPKGWKRVFIPVNAQLWLDMQADSKEIEEEFVKELKAKIKADKI